MTVIYTVVKIERQRPRSHVHVQAYSTGSSLFAMRVEPSMAGVRAHILKTRAVDYTTIDKGKTAHRVMGTLVNIIIIFWRKLQQFVNYVRPN